MVEYQYYNTMAYGASLLLSLSSTCALIIIDVSMSFRRIAKKTNFRDFSDIFGFRCTLQFILHHSFFIEKLEKPLCSNNIITNNIKREFQSHRTLSSSSQIEPHDMCHHMLHQLQSLKRQCIDNRWSVEDSQTMIFSRCSVIFSTSLALSPWNWFNRCLKNDIGFVVATQTEIHHVSDYRLMTLDGALNRRSTWVVSVTTKDDPQSPRAKWDDCSVTRHEACSIGLFTNSACDETYYFASSEYVVIFAFLFFIFLQMFAWMHIFC